MTGSAKTGITAYGGYVPMLRLNRQAAVQSNAWFNPGLTALARGERSFCNWDEDSLTMAVEASRDCLSGGEKTTISALYLASTTLPFSDRQNATIAATALNLADNIRTLDMTSSQRAATSGLITAVKAHREEPGDALFVAAEHRIAKAASPQELRYGDGAAAVSIGSSGVIAEFLGAEQMSVDFVDHFRGQHERFNYNWEDRWIRDEGYNKIIPGVIAAALDKSGLTPADIDHFVMPAVSASIPKRMAQSLGLSDDAVRDGLQREIGDTGAAHALLLLANTLAAAGPDETILMVGWGQGCDVLLFRTTDEISRSRPPMGVAGFLSRRREDTNYQRFLAFSGLVELDKGIRAENDTPTPMTALYRERETVLGFVGGECRQCGTAQFPKSNICVNPNCGAVDSQAAKPFADVPARVQSWTADRLAYSPDPPAFYGMIAFDGGGRCMLDFTDIDDDGVAVDTPMRMAFRIKEYDERRAFTKYFWKALPDYDAAMAGEANG